MAKYFTPVVQMLQAMLVGVVAYLYEAFQGVEGGYDDPAAILLGVVALLGTRFFGWLVGKIPKPPAA